ncbi:hypothetical protein ACIQLJ_00645 [Microbacterium sp. NPDC091313]
MARVGGRSAWIAWPIGLMCAGVVAVLVWLALPGIPGAVQFTGDMLRGATSAPLADGEGADATAQPATDCRSLYPDRLWAELTWTPQVLLSQNTAAPATTTALTAALTPSVRFTCTWRVADGRSISTTLASVADGSGEVAQAALTAEGFACTGGVDDLHCARTRDDVTEVHDIRGTAWLSSVLTRWQPDDYAEQTASRAF